MNNPPHFYRIVGWEGKGTMPVIFFCFIFLLQSVHSLTEEEACKQLIPKTNFVGHTTEPFDRHVYAALGCDKYFGGSQDGKIEREVEHAGDQDSPDVATVLSLWSDFPKHIPHYGIRRDIYTNNEVSMGCARDYMGNFLVKRHKDKAMVGKDNVNTTFEEFRRKLQCAPSEPGFDTATGSMALLKLLPPDSTTLERICAATEESCSSWSACGESVERYKHNEQYPSKFKNRGFEHFNLWRIVNNSLYVDWPWGKRRINRSYVTESPSDYLLNVIEQISDIGDSVFFMGGERPFFPWNIPFPALSRAPRVGQGDMSYIWPGSLVSLVECYKFISESKNGDRSRTYISYASRIKCSAVPWDERVPKATAFNSYRKLRHVICDLIALRPDLIDGMCTADNKEAKEPWNPLSREMWNDPSTSANWSGPGTLANLRKTIWNKKETPVAKYKYVISVGYELSQTGRLAQLLALSGCVVLMPEHTVGYHFSERLRPWVHFVPLTYSGSDLIDKIEWLRAHDDMAQQIAINARNFGQSYLRVEDHLCFLATTMKALSEATKHVHMAPIDASNPKYLAHGEGEPVWSPEGLASDEQGRAGMDGVQGVHGGKRTNISTTSTSFTATAPPSPAPVIPTAVRPLSALFSELTAPDFPEHIPRFDVRLDLITGEPVEGGRMSPTFRSASAKMELGAARRELQCAATEPDLDGNRGSLSLLQLLPPTKGTVEMMCMWASCKCSPWRECHERLDRWKKAPHSPGDTAVGHNHFYMATSQDRPDCGFNYSSLLLRIRGGKVFSDWPWAPPPTLRSSDGSGDGRNENKDQQQPSLDKRFRRNQLMEFVLRRITGLDDSVFLWMGSDSSFPSLFPFPAFSFSPRLPSVHSIHPSTLDYNMDENKLTDGGGSIPWPWPASFRDAMAADSGESGQQQAVEWKERVAKGVVHWDELDDLHQIVLDQAVLRPDLIHIARNNLQDATPRPLNPRSNEISWEKVKSIAQGHIRSANAIDRAGTLEALTSVDSSSNSSDPVQGSFKYVLVMGTMKQANPHLAYALSHSGAVVLLARSVYSYHFSARLRPWVHFVPVAFSGSDLIDKIEWLRAHDDMAQQLAINARNFGASFLRAEDYVCYAASALQSIAEVMRDTDATAAFASTITI